MERSVFRKGFTLVELLVVVAIIVILIAILVPSLTKAMYETQMASCAANQDSIGTGVLQYAMDNNRRYPNRTSYEYFLYLAGGDTAGGVGYQTYWVLGILKVGDGRNSTTGNPTGGAVGGQSHDDRPAYKKYFSLKAFGDPFCDPVDYESPGTNEGDVAVIASIDMWWDFGYVGEGKMAKMGNAVTWKSTSSDSPGKNYKWRVLASDRAVQRDDLPVALSSHPDGMDKMKLETEQGETTYIMTNQMSTIRIYASEYIGDGWTTTTYEDPQNSFDYNFLFDDGSVNSIRKIKGGKKDPRVTAAPIWQDPSLDPVDTNYHLMPANDH